MKRDFATITRMMAPKGKILFRATKLQELFDFDVDKIAAYKRTQSLFLNDRVMSKCSYGPIADNKGKLLVTPTKNGKFRPHYTLHWQFTK